MIQQTKNQFTENQIKQTKENFFKLCNGMLPWWDATNEINEINF
jgi:Ca2+-binding EF-hand superfamily protein